MFYDLNVPWTPNNPELQRTLAFLAERLFFPPLHETITDPLLVGYNVVALNHTLPPKLPSDLSCPIPSTLPFPTPLSLRLLRRGTVVVTDPANNPRLKEIASAYDILALRPTNERTLQQACLSLDCDIISLDFSTRFPFYFPQKTLAAALQRGIRLEICYACGIQSADGRRNLISNATQVIRTTHGRGIILSSEARKALACRGPWDVVNLATVWGLNQERGMEAVGREARNVVVQAEMKKTSFMGVIDVVYGGEKPEKMGEEDQVVGKGKRKANALESVEAEEKPMSKSQMKRQAKKARKENSESVVKGQITLTLATDTKETAEKENITAEASEGAKAEEKPTMKAELNRQSKKARMKAPNSKVKG